jgi:hypothetical protein
LKPTALYPAIDFRNTGLKTICGIVLASALVLMPVSTFAQRGAAPARAGGARVGGGVVRAPQAPIVRPPAPSTNRPAGAPIITRPPIMTRPMGMNPVAPFRGPVVPFRNPVTSPLFLQTRPPRLPIRPVVPLLGTVGSFGLAYNPFLFPGCNPFLRFAYGCGILAPYFGYAAYNPVGGYGPAYPGPAYLPDPVYSPPDTSASAPAAPLQYTPLLDQYPLLVNPSAQDVIGGSSVTAQSRNETLLYLKDGTVFAVASYTVSDGELHYATAYGETNDVLVDLIDLHNTIEANAERGVAFTLTPSATPGTPGASKPTPLGPAPAPEGPITPGRQ